MFFCLPIPVNEYPGGCKLFIVLYCNHVSVKIAASAAVSIICSLTVNVYPRTERVFSNRTFSPVGLMDLCTGVRFFTQPPAPLALHAACCLRQLV